MTRLISIHPLTWFVFAVAVVTGYFRELILFFSLIFIHEMGHYVMARFFHWRIRRIIILPFGGMLDVDEHGNTPFLEDVLVTIAGPLQHVWLIGFGFLLESLGLWSTGFFESFIAFNLMILGFNLLPIWPLDGGKLLFLLFAYLHPFKRAHLFLLVASSSILFLFIALSLTISTFHLNLIVILCFLAVAVYKEWRHHPYVFMRFLLERYETEKGTRKRRKILYVRPDHVIDQILKRFYKGVHHDIIVSERDSRQLATTDERTLLEAFFAKKRIKAPVSELIRLK